MVEHMELSTVMFRVLLFNATGGGTITFNSWANNEYCYWDAEYMEISYNGGSSWSVAINNCDGLWSNSNSKKMGLTPFLRI